MSFEVERGIPVPEGAGNKTRKRKYPFNTMEVGDSFSVEPYTLDTLRKVISASGSYGKNNNMEFSSQKTEDNKVRCWRIK